MASRTARAPPACLIRLNSGTDRYEASALPSLKIIYDVDGWAYHNEALALQKPAANDVIELVSGEKEAA